MEQHFPEFPKRKLARKENPNFQTFPITVPFRNFRLNGSLSRKFNNFRIFWKPGIEIFLPCPQFEIFGRLASAPDGRKKTVCNIFLLCGVGWVQRKTGVVR